MYTENPSQQATPLNEEHAATPATIPSTEFELRPTSGRREVWYAWLEVVKAMALWFTSFVLLAFVPAITALPYVVYRLATVGAVFMKTLPTDKLVLLLSVLGVLPAHLLTMLVVWRVMSDSGRKPFWKTIDFEWPEGWGPVLTTVACVGLAAVLFGLAQLAGYLYGERKTDLDLLVESSIYARMTTAFVATATAPLVEEVIYRGVLYRALEKAGGVAVAIPIVSLLFAGVHVYQYWNNIVVIMVITALSIVLTVTRAVTGKLLPAFIIHLAFNGIQSIFIVIGGFVDQAPAP